MSARTVFHAGAVSAILLMSGFIAQPAATAEKAAYLDPGKPLEVRVEDALSRMTLEEKVGLLSGGESFSTRGVKRLGIPALNVSDGPNGLRSNASEPTTAFPTGVSMAATWDPALISRVGAAIAEEAQAKNVQVVLGPHVNIVRTPLAGRNFETYSEDPYLAGRIGVGFVDGVQSKGVGTSPKHFTTNNQEHERLRGSSDLDERTLHEIYLPAFEMIVREAKPWTVMAAYNRVNGTYATDSRYLMKDILKGDWGFDGVLMSDWGAVHDTVGAITAGTDLEMPGPGRFRGAALVAAANDWQVPMADINDSARRMLRLIFRTGVMDGKPLPKGSVNTKAHQDVAREVAEEGIVLIKNEGGVLPLKRREIKSVAVIGPDADVAIIGGGGSSQVTAYHTVTALEGIKKLAGTDLKVSYEQGVENEPYAPTADARLFSPTMDRKEQGLSATYYASADFTGDVVSRDVESRFFKMGFGTGASKAKSMVMEGYFFPSVTGDYEFSLVTLSPMTLTVDGKSVITEATKAEPSPVLNFFPVHLRRASLHLEAGHAYKIRLAGGIGGARMVMRLGIRPPAGSIDAAVKLARSADAALVFVGTSTTSETEGRDRDSMALYGKQNELVEAVLKANPNTAVVLYNGAPMELPWLKDAKAVVEAWLPGQEGGDAVARILFGEVNPSGKMPETFPKRIEDNPTYLYYPGTRDAVYNEGIFVGYRYYDTKKIDPLIPFGHGLSYTTFGYGDLSVKATEKGVGVSLNVRNTGGMAGKEVVQLYVHDVKSSEARPFKELKGFEKVDLKAGKSGMASFDLGPRAFSYYDVHSHAWVCEPGAFDILVGSSSRDIRAKKTITLNKDCRLD